MGIYENYREDFLSAQAMVVVGVQKKSRHSVSSNFDLGNFETNIHMCCSWLLYCSRSAKLLHITVHENLIVLNVTHRFRQPGTQKHAGQVHVRQMLLSATVCFPIFSLRTRVCFFESAVGAAISSRSVFLSAGLNLGFIKMAVRPSLLHTARSRPDSESPYEQRATRAKSSTVLHRTPRLRHSPPTDPIPPVIRFRTDRPHSPLAVTVRSCIFLDICDITMTS
jgi:hypothetical protein